MQAALLERADAVLAFRQRHRLRQRHPAECRLPPIAEPLRRVARLRGEHRDQSIGGFDAPDARELIPDDPVLLLQRVEDLCDGRDRIRRREKP